MDYNFSGDLKTIRDILELSQDELSAEIGIEQITLSKIEMGEVCPSSKLLESIYSYAFNKNTRINKLKELLWRDDLGANRKLLFHGSKSEIIGNIDAHYGRQNNDFGQGFYAGETYEQSISYVSGYNESSVYFLSFDDENLKCKKYEVNQDWMMTVAYYRGTLQNYEQNPIIKNLVKESRDCDYIIAPIADNRMFQIINSFISGEITDEQCKHCLAATNLGKQYIFISDKAISQLDIIERCYISNNEREYYKNMRSEDSRLGDDKVKLARVQYRGQGKYIDEILK